MSGAETLDLCGLKCPLPALMTRRALLRAPPGSRLTVICDDPLCHIDIPHMAVTEGFAVITERRLEKHTEIVLRKD